MAWLDGVDHRFSFSSRTVDTLYSGHREASSALDDNSESGRPWDGWDGMHCWPPHKERTATMVPGEMKPAVVESDVISVSYVGLERSRPDLQEAVVEKCNSDSRLPCG